MDLPATCSITLGLARVMEVPKSESHQFSARPRSSKAGRVCSACASGAGPPGLGTEDKPVWGILASSGDGGCGGEEEEGSEKREEEGGG